MGADEQTIRVKLTEEGDSVALGNSTLLRYERTANELVLHLKLWNEALVELVIDDVVGVRDCCFAPVDTFHLERVDPRDAMIERIRTHVTDGAENLDVFRFMDPWGRVIIEAFRKRTTPSVS